MNVRSVSVPYNENSIEAYRLSKIVRRRCSAVKYDRFADQTEERGGFKEVTCSLEKGSTICHFNTYGKTSIWRRISVQYVDAEEKGIQIEQSRSSNIFLQ